MKIKKHVLCKKGQGLVEYLIIVAIMAVATMGVLRVVGQNLEARFTNIAYVLQGQNKKARYSPIERSHYQKRDLGNFQDGAASGDQGFGNDF